MESTVDTHKSVIEDLVRAFSGTTRDLVNEVRQEYGWDTGNFKNGGSWDTRFNRIKYAALQNGLIVLTRKRGIWTFITVVDPDSGTMYVFTKEKNLDVVIKNFGRNNIHYFHALVSVNSDAVGLSSQQTYLFPKVTDDYEARRVEEVQKILGEDYSLVDQVIFITAKEENREIVGVEAKLYNRFFEQLDTQDWSPFVPKDEYARILGVEEIVDNTDNVSIIPKVKQGLIDKRNMLEREASIKKKQKKDSTGNKE